MYYRIMYRTFFAASFLLVVILTVYYISNIYEKWTASPIIIALNAVATPVVDIPFPAVTICNMNQARESVVSSIVKGTAEDMLLQGLCNKPVNFTGTKSENTNWTKFREFLVRVGTAGVKIYGSFYRFSLSRFHNHASKFF